MKLKGIVTERRFGGTVECANAPEYLRIHHLIPVQLKGAEIGDSVELEYKTGPGYGLWFVVSINDVEV